MGEDKQTKSVITISNVLGNIGHNEILSELKRQCVSSKGSYNVMELSAKGRSIHDFHVNF